MNKIKELRVKRKISQQKLAAALNVHQTAISQWETGRTMRMYYQSTMMGMP